MNFQHITDGTNRQTMHNIIDNAYCAVLIYEDDSNHYRMTATAIPGCEDNILHCLNMAYSRAQGMIEDYLDEPEPLEEKGGRA